MALDAMERLSRLLERPEEKVALHYRMGKLYSGELGDHRAALEQFQNAIDLDDKHLPSLEAMRDIYLQEGDWRAAARVLEQASQLDLPARRGAELRVELGGLTPSKLDEHERAIECFEEAIKLDADNAGAARPLVARIRGAERATQDAEPLVQHARTQRGRARSGREAPLLVRVRPGCREARRRRHGSEGVRRGVRARQPGPGVAHRAWPRRCFRKQDWENAHKHYQMLLVHRRDELTPEQITDALLSARRDQARAGRAQEGAQHVRQGARGGRAPPSDARSADRPARPPERVGAGHPLQEALLECAADDGERFRLYDEIGELWQKELDNPAKAIEVVTSRPRRCSRRTT